MAQPSKPYTAVVRGLRMARGMSQTKLAELSKVSVRTVRAIEAEGTNPRAHVLLSILDALKATDADRARAMGGGR